MNREGSLRIAQGLRANSTLKKLTISFKQWEVEGQHEFFQCLEHNHTLEQLDVFDVKSISLESSVEQSFAYANNSIKILNLDLPNATELAFKALISHSILETLSINVLFASKLFFFAVQLN